MVSWPGIDKSIREQTHSIVAVVLDAQNIPRLALGQGSSGHFCTIDIRLGAEGFVFASGSLDAYGEAFSSLGFDDGIR